MGTRLSLSRHERGARRDGGGNFAAGALWDVPFRPSGFRGSCGERERRARRREGSEDAPGKTHRAGSEDASGVGGRVRSRDSSHTPNRQTDRKTDHKERPPPSSSMAQGSLPIKLIGWIVRWFPRSLIRSVARWFLCSFVRSLAHLFAGVRHCSLVPSLVRSFALVLQIHSSVRSLCRSPVRSFLRSFARSRPASPGCIDFYRCSGALHPLRPASLLSSMVPGVPQGRLGGGLFRGG